MFSLLVENGDKVFAKFLLSQNNSRKNYQIFSIELSRFSGLLLENQEN